MTIQEVCMIKDPFFLSSPNMVLGIEWFKIVGRVLLDFVNKSMKFNWLGTRLT